MTSLTTATEDVSALKGNIGDKYLETASKISTRTGTVNFTAFTDAAVSINASDGIDAEDIAVFGIMSQQLAALDDASSIGIEKHNDQVMKGIRSTQK